MADNVTLPGTGIDVAADDVSSVFFQKVKLDVGGDGVSVPAVSGHGTATGALRVELPTDGTGVIATVGTITNAVHVDDNSGSLTVDAPVATPVYVRLSDGSAAISTLPVSLASVPSHAVTQSGTWTVQPGNTANTTAWKVDASSVPVPITDNSGSLTVDNNGTFAVQASGSVAHDGVDSGNPVKFGLKAETSPKGITLVSDGDRTDAYGDADGLQMVKLNTSFADIISERVTDTGGTSTAFTNFSAVASTKNYVTAIAVYNTSGTAGFVDIRDGTSGSVLWTMPLPAGGGSVISAAQPLFHGSANTALAYDVSDALTTVYISVSGFQSKI